MANKKVGIIGTQATIQSEIYKTVIHEVASEITVCGKACPLFVPLVEEGLTQDFVTREIATRYLEELIDEQIDTLILGCTHYPLLRKMIGEILGKQVKLVNPAYETARELRELLTRQRITNNELKKEKNKMYELYVSDTADKFKEFAKSILPVDVETIQQINIEEY